MGLQDYQVLDTIGSGSYGLCKKIKRTKDSRILVWKELDYGSMSEAEKSMLVSEVNLLRELKHRYIVRYYDRIIDRSTTTLYIIMEYCEGGDLATYITKMKKSGSSVPEAYVWRVCYQIVSALKVCHSRSRNGKTILHRDLKPANVFLDNNNDVKLGDFGLARVLNHETSFARTFVGTPYYMSPEQMNCMSYNEKSDVWSLGCLLYELCVYRPPFTASNQRELAARICTGRFARLPIRYSDDLNEIIAHMLQVDEAKRPTMERLSEHPLLVKYSPDQQNSQSSEMSYNQKLESLRERESQAQNRESLLQDKENALKDLENNLKEREKQLKDKEAAVRLKERDVESKERTVLALEKEVVDQLSRLKNIREKLHRSSPRMSLTDGRRRDSTNREPGEMATSGISDSGIFSPFRYSEMKTPRSRESSSNNREVLENFLPQQHDSDSSLDKLLADFEERKKKKSLTGRSPFSVSSPCGKMTSPRSENSQKMPKQVTSGKSNRCPLETIAIGNEIHDYKKPTLFSSRFTPTPPQLVLKDTMLKLFKKSPPLIKNTQLLLDHDA